jgi:hypothetical protein
MEAGRHQEPERSATHPWETVRGANPKGGDKPAL